MPEAHGLILIVDMGQASIQFPRFSRFPFPSMPGVPVNSTPQCPPQPVIRTTLQRQPDMRRFSDVLTPLLAQLWTGQLDLSDFVSSCKSATALNSGPSASPPGSSLCF